MKHPHPTHPVPVGTIVWFFQNAQEGTKPLPAIVIEMSESLVARLLVIDRDGGFRPKMSCYPLGSPQIYDHAGHLKPGAVMNGTWTYHPWQKPQLSDLPVEEQVRAAYGELQDIDEVAKRFRSRGIKKSDVEALVAQ